MSSTNTAAPEVTSTNPAVSETTSTGQTQNDNNNSNNIFANAFHHIVKAITPVPDDVEKNAKSSNEETTTTTTKQQQQHHPIDAMKEKITDALGKFVDAITPVPECSAVTTSETTNVVANTETTESKPKEINKEGGDQEGEKNPFVNAFHKLVEVITPVPDTTTPRGGNTDDAALDDTAIVEGVGIPKYLNDALNVVTPNQRQLIITLYTQYGQEHLFQKKYFNSKSPPSMRRQLAQQLESLDQEYVDGGLVGCIKNVRTLLQNSKYNINPLDGWKPTLDTTSSGKTFTLGTSEYQEMEAKGLPELGAIGFVLVAGGLGERLGYSGIKVRYKSRCHLATVDRS
jgi:hypothetical protein